MQFQTPLMPATLIRRYKRFLADIVLPDGTKATAHCANPGAMTGLAMPGARIWVDRNDDPKRKLRYGWKLVELDGGHMACVDTGQANRVVEEALRAGRVPGLPRDAEIRREVRYGQGSRVDFLLSGAGGGNVWVEVKSVTLSRQPGLAEFPDAVTRRGARHLAELANMVTQGDRAVMLYLVQRTDCTQVSVAADIDPAYARACAQAVAQGVEIMGFSCDISVHGLQLGESIAINDC
ncbi:MAG: DNA/RNA nuclease SfsA [Paracoccaceae bacterium]|nr:DNA/RNA nuclease SfsA [Paracoccaceae bacterium]